MQDLIAIYLPDMIITALLAILACIIYDPSMSLLLYSGLPEVYQNRFTFWICMVEETRFLMFMAGMDTPTWQSQVISFDFVSKNLEEIMEKLTSNG